MTILSFGIPRPRLDEFRVKVSPTVNARAEEFSQAMVIIMTETVDFWSSKFDDIENHKFLQHRIIKEMMRPVFILICFISIFIPSSAFLLKPSKLLNRVHQNYYKQIRLQSTTTSDVVEQKGETFKFESNVARVMDIIINSLYSNKDVFIRELISNAADACDKKRFLSLTDGKVADNLGIRIYANREKNTLTIEDRGIGMNRADLINNLGRIAESGTKRFMENLGKDKKDDVSLIGQFGVGFYSGFLVANKMTVITKGSEGQQLKWEALADSLDQYTFTEDTTTDSTPIESTGARIILTLKDDCDQYLDETSLKALIEKYSEFIPVPIELQRSEL